MGNVAMRKKRKKESGKRKTENCLHCVQKCVTIRTYHQTILRKGVKGCSDNLLLKHVDRNGQAVLDGYFAHTKQGVFHHVAKSGLHI